MKLAVHAGALPVIFRRRGAHAEPLVRCNHLSTQPSVRAQPAGTLVLPSYGMIDPQMRRPPGVTQEARLRERWRAGASLMDTLTQGRCKRRSTSGEKGGDVRGLTISLTSGS